MDAQRRLEWLCWCAMEYRQTMNIDITKEIKDLLVPECLGQGFTLMDPLEEIDIGEGAMEYRQTVNTDITEAIKDLLVLECFGQGFTPMDPLEEIDIGEGDQN